MGSANPPLQTIGQAIAPCRTSRRKLSTKVMQEVRSFAKELQKKGALPPGLDIAHASWDKLCDHLENVEGLDKGLVAKILAGVTVGFALLSATSHMRHPHGPVQVTHLGTRTASHQLAVAKAPKHITALENSLLLQQPLPANVTLPRIQRFLKGATLLDEQKGCLIDYQKMAGFVREHVEHVKATNKKLTAQGDPLGLRPGTHIFYTGAFKQKKLSHHGVYLGDGLVMDVGSIPATCKAPETKARNAATMKAPIAFKANGIGITHLGEFAKRGEDVFQIAYKKTLPPQQILENAWNAIGPQKYNLVGDNCEHFTTEMVTGVRESHQVKEAKLGAKVGATIVGLPVAAAKFIRAYQVFRSATHSASRSATSTQDDFESAVSDATALFLSARSKTTAHASSLLPKRGMKRKLSPGPWSSMTSPLQVKYAAR